MRSALGALFGDRANGGSPRACPWPWPRVRFWGVAWLLVGVLLAMTHPPWIGTCLGAGALGPESDRPAAPTESHQQEFPVPPKPLPKSVTPCSACHGKSQDFPINWTRKETLRVHSRVRLNHGGRGIWCLDCHHPTERDFLQPLSDGTPIPFERSYLLCGKCHGTKFRDWRDGLHGRRTGYWNGRKEYLLCVHCHRAHSPRFRPIKPMPAPQKPWTPKKASAR